MEAFAPELLTAAVTAICPDVETRVQSKTLETDERRLWKELSTCLLSSQVPYDLALAAAEAVEQSNILHDAAVVDISDAIEGIEQVLSARFEVSGRPRFYRFRKSKATQLARTLHFVRTSHGTLPELLASFDGNDEEARQWFIMNAPGIGPKQASMFLRNVGFTYELAILDRHVLNYMLAIKLDTPRYSGSSGWYNLCERSLRQHARSIGYPVGILDWAIWIVMRAASDLSKPSRPRL